MDFKVTDYKKFIEVVSDSPLPLTFEELPHVECCIIVWKKNIHNYLRRLLKYSLSQLHVFVRLDFLHVFQQNNILQQTKGRSRQKNPAVYSLNQTFNKNLQKCQAGSFFSLNLFVWEYIVIFFMKLFFILTHNRVILNSK